MQNKTQKRPHIRGVEIAKTTPQEHNENAIVSINEPIELYKTYLIMLNICIKINLLNKLQIKSSLILRLLKLQVSEGLWVSFLNTRILEALGYYCIIGLRI